MFQVLRSFALALIMYVSVKALGLTAPQAGLAAAIPLILGIIDVMTATAFSMTGCVFILAVLAHVFPGGFLVVKSLAASVIKEAGAAMGIPNSNASTDPAPAHSRRPPRRVLRPLEPPALPPRAAAAARRFPCLRCRRIAAL